MKGVKQRNGVIRFDIEFHDPTFPINTRRFMRAVGARLRTDLPPRLRNKDMEVGAGVFNKPVSGKAKAMTLNINGINRKLSEVVMLIRREQPVFFMLQETNRKMGSYRLLFEGYKVIESQAANRRGSHGLALGVQCRKGWNLSELDSTCTLLSGVTRAIIDSGKEESILLAYICLHTNQGIEGGKEDGTHIS